MEQNKAKRMVKILGILSVFVSGFLGWATTAHATNCDSQNKNAKQVKDVLNIHSLISAMKDDNSMPKPLRTKVL